MADLTEEKLFNKVIIKVTANSVFAQTQLMRYEL